MASASQQLTILGLAERLKDDNGKTPTAAENEEAWKELDQKAATIDEILHDLDEDVYDTTNGKGQPMAEKDVENYGDRPMEDEDFTERTDDSQRDVAEQRLREELEAAETMADLPVGETPVEDTPAEQEPNGNAKSQQDTASTPVASQPKEDSNDKPPTFSSQDSIKRGIVLEDGTLLPTRPLDLSKMMLQLGFSILCFAFLAGVTTLMFTPWENNDDGPSPTLAPTLFNDTLENSTTWEPTLAPTYNQTEDQDDTFNATDVTVSPNREHRREKETDNIPRSYLRLPMEQPLN